MLIFWAKELGDSIEGWAEEHAVVKLDIVTKYKATSAWDPSQAEGLRWTVPVGQSLTNFLYEYFQADVVAEAALRAVNYEILHTSIRELWDYVPGSINVAKRVVRRSIRLVDRLGGDDVTSCPVIFNMLGAIYSAELSAYRTSMDAYRIAVDSGHLLVEYNRLYRVEVDDATGWRRASDNVINHSFDWSDAAGALQARVAELVESFKQPRSSVLILLGGYRAFLAYATVLRRGNEAEPEKAAQATTCSSRWLLALETELKGKYSTGAMSVAFGNMAEAITKASVEVYRRVSEIDEALEAASNTLYNIRQEQDTVKEELARQSMIRKLSLEAISRTRADTQEEKNRLAAAYEAVADQYDPLINDLETRNNALESIIRLILSAISDHDMAYTKASLGNMILGYLEEYLLTLLELVRGTIADYVSEVGQDPFELVTLFAKWRLYNHYVLALAEFKQADVRPTEAEKKVSDILDARVTAAYTPYEMIVSDYGATYVKKKGAFLGIEWSVLPGKDLAEFNRLFRALYYGGPTL